MIHPVVRESSRRAITRPCPRRGRYPLANAVVLLVAAIILNASFTPIGHKKPLYCLADDSPEDDDDFLAEILAEQAREDEELSRMEAEAREADAVKARRSSAGDAGGGGTPGGGPKTGKTEGPGRAMPGGAGGADFSKFEDDLKKKEEENASKKAARGEEEAARDAERIRSKREAAFEAELKKMNEEQRKKAKRQKSRDAKVVTRILKAHKTGKHYAVLGVRNLELQLGPFYMFDFSFGPFVLFRVKTKAIKRVYRNLARTVHPDKNRDGRAVEAFHALETSAAILTDEKQRSNYDKKIISARRRRNKYAMESVVGASQLAWRRSVSTLRVAKGVLGPFSTPILVVGALII